MNRLYLTFFLSLSLTCANAQYVLIPDSNFRHALFSQGFALCFDSTLTMLDTTCSSVLDSTDLIVANDNISNIEGVQYFKNLWNLDCGGNKLTSLPALPNNLLQLICTGNGIVVLPSLPIKLTSLLVNNNNISALPILPSSLSLLNFSGNNISVFPTVPDSLILLSCSDNPLDSIPPLPPHLNELQCGFQNIRVLPSLPATLTQLTCVEANLDSLPMLPDSLKQLICEGNQLTALPILPGTLIYLDCSYNQLTSLPSLPDSMYWFHCENNKQLNCLPRLKRIENFEFDSTGLTCLPDTDSITYSYPPLSSLPLCGPNGCTVSGIDQLTTSNTNLKVYPNPATDAIFISLDYSLYSRKLWLSDMTGKIIYNTTCNGQNLQVIDISKLAAGVYFVSLQGENGQLVRKFVKE